jgi:hypothetical protein
VGKRVSRRGGRCRYTGSFIEHYIVALIYPQGLTPQTQVVLGIAVVALNAAIYGLAWRKSRRDSDVRERNPPLRLNRSVH